jgi:hypothetical protein
MFGQSRVDHAGKCCINLSATGMATKPWSDVWLSNQVLRQHKAASSLSVIQLKNAENIVKNKQHLLVCQVQFIRSNQPATTYTNHHIWPHITQPSHYSSFSQQSQRVALTTEINNTIIIITTLKRRKIRTAIYYNPTITNE